MPRGTHFGFPPVASHKTTKCCRVLLRVARKLRTTLNRYPERSLSGGIKLKTLKIKKIPRSFVS